MQSKGYILPLIQKIMRAQNLTVGDHVIISKYQNIFAKGFFPN